MCLNLCNPTDCSKLGSVYFTISQSLFKFRSIELVVLYNYLILCHPLHLLSSVFPSIRVFSMSRLFTSVGQSTGTSASACPSNEYSRLIFLKIESFHLLTVQGTLKSLLWHHSLKTSVLWHSVFFMVQLLHPYLITGKTIALRIQTYVGKLPTSIEP